MRLQQLLYHNLHQKKQKQRWKKKKEHRERQLISSRIFKVGKVLVFFLCCLGGICV